MIFSPTNTDEDLLYATGWVGHDRTPLMAVLPGQACLSGSAGSQGLERKDNAVGLLLSGHPSVIGALLLAGVLCGAHQRAVFPTSPPSRG